MRKKAMLKKNRKSFLLRLPAQTLSALANLARSNNLSANSQIRGLIEKELLRNENEGFLGSRISK